MQIPTNHTYLSKTLRNRREKLAKLIDFPTILWSGSSSSRNFPANTFPFRPSSHFLYFAGLPIEDAAIRLEGGKLELFMDNLSPSNLLWHGEIPTRDRLAEIIGADAAFPIKELKDYAANEATIYVQNPTTKITQCQILNRDIFPSKKHQKIDLELTKAIISLRLSHDDMALTEIKQAAAVTVKAHKAGMAATKNAKFEANIRAAMESIIISHNMTCAYNSIVTVHGEVLHNGEYYHPLQTGDLLLADVGAETTLGWASDVTRTWPISGKFSPTQRDIYDVVLAAHDNCIAQLKPGVEYLDIHLLAAKTIAEGLVNLGILKGQPEQLVEMDAHALFFPHGVGHLLGLDVHDMEDLGDLAGYEIGRERSSRFGLSFLRLNRPLASGMLVTIEPGFYQVPAILNNTETRQKYQHIVNWEKLKHFSDVRGIRIEDDLLVTTKGAEILTKELPSNTDAIENLL